MISRALAALGLSAALWSTHAQAVRAEASALLVRSARERGLSVSDRAARDREISHALQTLGVSVSPSPLSVEQLALTIGCEAQSDACLVRLAREVAQRPLVVARAERGGARRLVLISVAPATGQVSELWREPAQVPQAGALHVAPPSPVTGTLSREEGVSGRAGPAEPAMSPAARIVGTATLSAAAVMIGFGIAQGVSAHRAAGDYRDAAVSSAGEVDNAERDRDAAEHHARVARGVFAGAAVLGTSGVLALIWHKIPGRSRDAQAMPPVSVAAWRDGAMLALRGSWGEK